MYRYLEKFTGTYRVLGELDLDTKDFPRDEDGNIDKSYEDLYIPCSRGKSKIKHTYEQDRLVACFYNKASMAKNVYREIKDKYKNIDIHIELVGEDGLIYFNADDIKKIATIVTPKTSGASIKWNSNRNLPKVQYDIPKSDIDKLNKLTKDMDKINKMQFGRKLASVFLEEYNLKDECKLSRLDTKEFIHSRSLWEEYINTANKLIKEM